MTLPRVQKAKSEAPTPIPLPPGFLARPALRYMSRDPESATERGTMGGFAKAMLLDGRPAIVEVTLLAGTAQCRIERARSRRAVAEAHRAVHRLLGLGGDPRPFERKVSRDVALAPLIATRRGLRVPQTATVFESLVWAIVGQQVNLAFAFKLRRALIELTGLPVGGMRAHPDPHAVAQLDYSDLTRRQFSRRKAEYLIDLARLAAQGAIDIEALPEESAVTVEQRLLAARGLGAWSAHYIMMRGCGFADCVPLGDTGLTTSLQTFFGLQERPDRETTGRLMSRFAPFRSLATLHFWMRLSESAM